MIIADSLTSKEMVQMYSGQLLMFIGQTMQGHVNWALSIIASLLGLVVVFFSIINAIKKAKISDLVNQFWIALYLFTYTIRDYEHHTRHINE